jgi:hypothetical protein
MKFCIGSRGGVDFNPFYFVIVSLILFGLLVGAIYVKVAAPEVKLGDRQAQLVSGYQEMVSLRSFILQSGNLATEQGLDDLYQSVALKPVIRSSLDHTPCGMVEGIPYLISKDENCAYFDFVGELNSKVNSRMNTILRKYNEQHEYTVPLDNYELYATPTEIRGVGLSSVTIPFAGGSATYTPGFSYTTPQDLSVFPTIRELALTVVEQCKNREDTPGCVEYQTNLVKEEGVSIGVQNQDPNYVFTVLPRNQGTYVTYSPIKFAVYVP